MAARPSPKPISLDHIKAGAWLLELKKTAPGFTELCDILGEPYVAFGVAAGIQFTGLHGADPDHALVEFVVTEEESPHQMPAHQFRRAISAAMLGEEQHRPVAFNAQSDESIRALLGARNILLATVFGIELVALHVYDDEPPKVEVIFAESRDKNLISIEEFWLLIRERIRAEARRSRLPSSPYTLNLTLVSQAREAVAQNDQAKVIELLERWPGPLSLLVRSPEGQSLDEDSKREVSEGLMLLSKAYMHENAAKSVKQNLSQAKDVLLLSLQFSPRGAIAARAYLQLGEIQVLDGQHGEAIGTLKRALQLGADASRVYPLLGDSFLERKKYAGAAIAYWKGKQPFPAALEQVVGESWKSVLPYLKSIED